mmetsp:Transcript_7782/g.48265  ORF Transcript_7782/g.48265 Transcript_7782/m.48265 type:complete len:265 (+) Transcript_7782:2739-3533(+)
MRQECLHRRKTRRERRGAFPAHETATSVAWVEEARRSTRASPHGDLFLSIHRRRPSFRIPWRWILRFDANIRTSTTNAHLWVPRATRTHPLDEAKQDLTSIQPRSFRHAIRMLRSRRWWLLQVDPRSFRTCTFLAAILWPTPLVHRRPPALPLLLCIAGWQTCTMLLLGGKIRRRCFLDPTRTRCLHHANAVRTFLCVVLGAASRPLQDRRDNKRSTTHLHLRHVVEHPSRTHLQPPIDSRATEAHRCHRRIVRFVDLRLRCPT